VKLPMESDHGRMDSPLYLLMVKCFRLICCLFKMSRLTAAAARNMLQLLQQFRHRGKQAYGYLPMPVLSERVYAMIKLPANYNATALAALKGGFGDAKVHLFKNDIDPEDVTEIADFVESDFSNYAAPAFTPASVPVLDSDGLWHLLFAPHVFVYDADPVSAQNAYGYYLTFEDAATLWMAERFPEPIPFGDNPKAVMVMPELKMPTLIGEATIES